MSMYGTLGTYIKFGVTRRQVGMKRSWEVRGLGQVRKSLMCLGLGAEASH